MSFFCSSFSGLSCYMRLLICAKELQVSFVQALHSSKFFYQIYCSHDPLSLSGCFLFILTPVTANVSSPGRVALSWHLSISKREGLLICKGNGYSVLPSVWSCFTSFFIFKHCSWWVLWQSWTQISMATQCVVKATLMAAMFLWVICQRHGSVRAYTSSGFWVILDLVVWSCPGLH